MPRTRVTVIMTVFVTVTMTVIRQARAISGGRGFLMSRGPAGAWRQPGS